MLRIATELSCAVRHLLRHPGHTLALTGVLTVGLTLAIGMFEGFNAYLLRPIPVPEPERVMAITATYPGQGVTGGSLSLYVLTEWRQRQHAFEALAGFYQGTFNVGGTAQPERLAGAFVSDQFFESTGVAPELGRGVSEADCVPGAPSVLVLGHATWLRSFAGDPAIIGRVVRLNGQAAEIVGVMPAGFRLPWDEDAWTALTNDSGTVPRNESRQVQVIGRLAPGVSLGQAQAELASVTEQLTRELPDDQDEWVPAVEQYAEVFIDSQTRATVSTLFISTILVLLVACANVANLIVARLAARDRELSVRSALGASTAQLIRPILSECLLVSAVATTISFALSRAWVVWVTEMLQRTDATRPFWVQFDPDWRSALFAAAAAVACTLMAGLLSAWRLARRDPIEGLRSAGRGAVGTRLGKMSRALVGVEVALACVVLACAGLMVRSAINVGKTSLGAHTEGVLTGRIGLFPADYPEDADCRQLHASLLRRLEAMPGGTGAALSTSLPGTGSDFRAYQKEGIVAEAGSRPPYTRFAAVSPGYFSLLEVPILAGRGVSDSDTADAPAVTVINAMLAERLGGAESALGTRLELLIGDSSTVHTVVGVVANVQQGRIDSSMSPTAYVPLAQSPARFVSLLVRTAGDPSTFSATLRATVRQADPNLPVYWLQPLVDWAGQRIVLQRFLASMFGMFAGAGLLLAATGLFAVLAQVVSGRTAEIGLRRALGAPGSGIVTMIARQNGWPVGIGLVAGLTAGVGLAHLIANELVGVNPTDPLTTGLSALTVTGCAAMAAWGPARRAVRVDPATALRAE